MKKLLSTALALILATTMFTACAPSAPDQQTANKAIIEYTTEGKVTKLVGDPNATGELTISRMDVSFGEYSKSSTQLAVEKFKVLYPQVKVNIETIIYTNGDSYYEYSKKLQTEVMSGKGPDIFWMMSGMDPFKMAKSGRLVDITEFIENDKNFNVSDYNQKIFYSGQMNGKQYVIPSRYAVPILLTTETAAKLREIDPDNFTGYYSSMQEIDGLLQKNKEVYGMKSPIVGLSPLFSDEIFMNFMKMDYENNSVNIHDIKKPLQVQKSIADNQEVNGISVIGGFDSAKSLLSNQSALVFWPMGCFYDILDNSRYILNTDKPIIMPMRNIDDGVTALAFDVPMINNACNDRQNAYNFIKVLISPEIQGYMDEVGTDTNRHMIVPISNLGRDAVLTKMQKTEVMKNYMTDEDYNLVGLSDEFIDSYKKIVDDVSDVVYETPADKIFKEELKPYFEDKVDIDTCLQSLQDKLEIYI